MDRYEDPPPHLLEGLQRLLRRRMTGSHDVGRQVGADREQRQVERAEALADLLESPERRRVTSEVQPTVAPLHGPARPEPAGTVPPGATGEARSRQARERPV